MNHLEFQEFRKADPAAPPAALTQSILSQVHQSLHPSAWMVFAKLSAIHFATSCLTLSFCPQFGWNPWGEGMGLMSFFMTFGHSFCMIACGFLFLSISLLIAALALRPEEIRVIRRNRWSKLAALTLLSLGFFLMVDPERVLAYGLLWMTGSLLGGLLALEVSWGVRLRLLTQPSRC